MLQVEDRKHIRTVLEEGRLFREYYVSNAGAGGLPAATLISQPGVAVTVTPTADQTTALGIDDTWLPQQFPQLWFEDIGAFINIGVAPISVWVDQHPGDARGVIISPLHPQRIEQRFSRLWFVLDALAPGFACAFKLTIELERRYRQRGED